MSLKAAIEKSKSGHVKCNVAIVRAGLEPAQQAELDEACRQSIDKLPHAVLSRAVKSEWDVNLSASTLQRHRAKECRCDSR